MQSKPFAFLAAAAIAVLVAAGCSKGSDQSSSTTTTTTDSSPAAATATTSAAADTSGSASGSASGASSVMGDAGHGKQIFSANCASCHGPTGHEGGVGPSLTNEKSKKNYQQTIAWIHNPQPPMPKLWPSPLGDKDVQDVAAYVQSL